MTQTVAIWLGIFALVEVSLWALVRSHRKSFQWLIVRDDIAPDLPIAATRAYLERSFDAELGWLRKPNTAGRDRTGEGEVEFHISGDGARTNPGFEDQPSTIAVFGDSFAFCRLVADSQTWPHHLSRLCGTNVRNFGVGNYGLDQAVLRLEREIAGLPARVIVIAVVPETIARIHSYWKHYFEYGNVLAFKPVFQLDNGRLTLQKIPPAVIKNLRNYRTSLDQIATTDPFFHTKFRRDLFCFPFVLSLVRRARRHVPILWHLSIGALSGRRAAARARAFNVVLRENASVTAQLYASPPACALLSALLDRFANLCRQHDKQPVFVILPQPADLERVRAAIGDHRTAVNALGKVPTMDLTNDFMAHPDNGRFYVEGDLGPHISDTGNRRVADELYRFLTRHQMLTPAPPQRAAG